MNYNFKPFPVLECDRLVLNQLETKHCAALFSYQSDKLNFPCVDMPVYKVVDETQSYIEKMKAGVDKNQWIIWAICLKGTGEIVGTVSIWNLNMSKNQGELGYGIFPEYRRRGYMVESIHRVLDYAFNTMKLDKVEAYTSHVNYDSIKFLKHIKFIHEGTIEDEYSGGALMDVFYREKI